MIPYLWRYRCRGCRPAPWRSRICIANYANRCCATLSALDLRATKRRMWCKTRLSACSAICRREETRKTSVAGCFALFIIRPEIVRRATTGDLAKRSTGEWISWRIATPEQVLLRKEKLCRVAAAIQLLTESERECLLLRAGGLRYREIGEVLGIATSTVGDTMERAMRKLAEKCNV